MLREIYGSNEGKIIVHYLGNILKYLENYSQIHQITMDDCCTKKNHRSISTLAHTRLPLDAQSAPNKKQQQKQASACV